MANNIIIDKRQESLGGSVGNRKRFLDRARRYMEDSLKRAFKNRSLTDNDSNELLTVKGGLKEPKITYSNEGRWWDIYCGNNQFVVGDRIEVEQETRCRNGQGSVSDGEPQEDEFKFMASPEEFYSLIFDGLELPKMKRVGEFVTKELKHAGLSPVGLPNNLDLPRTFANAMVRTMAMESVMDEEIEDLVEKISNCKDTNEVTILTADLNKLREEKEDIPAYDDRDCIYRVKQEIKHRTRRAVMFCLMDVSGSMTQQHKHIAKQFFLLLNRFLSSKYDECEIVFIRYHSQAIECDEKEFFDSTETGGTVISEATHLADAIIKQRYPVDKYNIYVALCSDGDVWTAWDQSSNGDAHLACNDIESWIPFIRQFYYIDILNDADSSASDFFKAMMPLESRFPDTITIAAIPSEQEVIPVFQEIFKG